MTGRVVPINQHGLIEDEGNAPKMVPYHEACVREQRGAIQGATHLTSRMKASASRLLIAALLA
jgi:hypothetical protein